MVLRFSAQMVHALPQRLSAQLRLPAVTVW